MGNIDTFTTNIRNHSTIHTYLFSHLFVVIELEGNERMWIGSGLQWLMVVRI